MLQFFQNLFKGETAQAPHRELPVLHYSCAAADDERHSVAMEDGAAVLTIKRANVFAWADVLPEAGTGCYGDAAIEADIRFSAPNAKCAVGLILRKTGDNSFYYMLVSAEGNVRLDVVTNGLPRPLVPWIACPSAAGSEAVVVNVITRGLRILVLVNGRFALEAEDDSLPSGGIAFAAQTYDGTAAFSLRGLKIITEAIDVETAFAHFSRLAAAETEQRIRLAEGLFTMEYYVPALVELSKLQTPTARGKFLEAECKTRLGLYDEAAAAIERCLEAEPSMEEAVEERYNIMYLRGEYIRLKDELLADQARMKASPRLLNLLGHAWYNVAEWDAAAEAYNQAFALDSSMPIYAKNSAAAFEKASGKKAAKQAADAWLKAAMGFYSEGAWDDTEECAAALRALSYDRDTLDALSGLVAFGRGDKAQAEKLLAPVYAKGKADAAAAYIYGLIVGERDKKEAIPIYAYSVEQEPETALYRFRLAEAQFLAGQNCEKELQAALRCAPHDGWIQNLAGQLALRDGRVDAAVRHFRKAFELLPCEAVPAVNLSQALSDSGRHDEAITVLGTYPAVRSDAANRLGNALAAQGRLEEALEAYAKACETGTNDCELGEYRVNMAAALFELGRPAEAENTLRPELYNDKNARAYMVMGDIAMQYGDFVRAEMAYRTAVAIEPHKPAALMRFAQHYIVRRRYAEAEALCKKLSELSPQEAKTLQTALHDAQFDTASCAACSRVWDIPKEVPAVSRANLRGEPPDESPAGACPACGKIYCVACRKKKLNEGRFTCPACGVNLNLNDNRLRWLVTEYIRGRRRGL